MGPGKVASMAVRILLGLLALALVGLALVRLALMRLAAAAAGATAPAAATAGAVDLAQLFGVEITHGKNSPIVCERRQAPDRLDITILEGRRAQFPERRPESGIRFHPMFRRFGYCPPSWTRCSRSRLS